jgi:uncharacterized protein (TIGR03435 family)
MLRNYRWTVMVVVLAASSAAAAQNGAAGNFEVASVKPMDPNAPIRVGVTVQPSGRVVLSGMPLQSIIHTAFGVAFWQISGGEDWVRKDIYVIEAKAPENSGITNFTYSLYDINDGRLREMLQAVLVDRFQLRVHRETKTGDVYELTRTERPLKLAPAKIPEGRDRASMRGNIGYARARWGLSFYSMPQLAKFASDYIVRASVVDRTNLSGEYDYTQMVPDPDPSLTGDDTDSFLRLLKDVGLELKRSKGSVETLVIDSAAKPTPD